MQEIVQFCLSLQPIPGLGAAFQLLSFIRESSVNLQSSKERMNTLAACVAELLIALQRAIESGRATIGGLQDRIYSLERLLNDVANFIRRHSNDSWVKWFVHSQDWDLQIEEFYKRINASSVAFQIVCSINNQEWQQRHSLAVEGDRRNLIRLMEECQSSQNNLYQLLLSQQASIMSIITALSRQSNQTTRSAQELAFIKHSLSALRGWSGQDAQIEQWTISPIEVDTGESLGAGGYGEVFTAVWNRTRVAKKAFKTIGKAKPDPKFIEEEVQMLLALRHPNVVSIFGANVLDDEPFIIMDLHENGNARAFLRKNPEVNRLELLRGATCGLVYLHSHMPRIVHGDIKAANILISSSFQAVLCDFGLSRIASDTASRVSVSDAVLVEGSFNWMAPERLKGSSKLRPSSDIYSLGVTMWEFYSLETPFSSVHPLAMRDTVDLHNERPERPDEEDNYTIHPMVWDLMERCWTKPPNGRPTAEVVFDTMSEILRVEEMAGFATTVPASNVPLQIAPNSQEGEGKTGIEQSEECQAAVDSPDRPSSSADSSDETTPSPICSLDTLSTVVSPALAHQQPIASKPLPLGPDPPTQLHTPFAPPLLPPPYLLEDPYSSQRRKELQLCAFDIADSEAVGFVKAELAFALDRDQTGPLMQSTLVKLFELAQKLSDDTRHGEAVEVLDLVLKQGRNVKGCAEPYEQAIACMMECGTALIAQERYAESERAYAIVRAEREEVLGPRHADTLTALHNLGEAICGQRPDEALKILMSCLEARREVLGPVHESTGRTQVSVAACLLLLERFGEAESLLADAHTILVAAHGERHYVTLGAMYYRGLALLWQEKSAEGIPVLNQLLVLGDRVLDKNSVEMISSFECIGDAMTKTAKWIEAEKAYHDAYKRSLTCPLRGKEHAVTARIRGKLDACGEQIRLLGESGKATETSGVRKRRSKGANNNCGSENSLH